MTGFINGGAGGGGGGGGSGTPTGSAGGDLSGTYPNPSVSKVRGTTVSATAPTDGYVLTYVSSNTDWEPKPAPSGSFTAGGDLSGTSSSQTVAKINHTTVSTAGGSLTTGNVLRVTGASAIDYGAVNLASSNAVTGTLPTANQASQSLSGDLSGTTASATVTKLQNRTVASTAPTDGYVLTWVAGSSDWEPKPTLAQISGDITGTTAASVVSSISGSAPINITADTTVLNSSGTSPVLSVVKAGQTTDGYASAIVTFAHPDNTLIDWIVTFIGRANLNTGEYYRCDFAFSSQRYSGGSATINAASPLPTNTRSNGAGSAWLPTITASGNNVLLNAVGATATVVDWSVTYGIQERAGGSTTPNIISISPTSGLTTGSTPVTITGTNFASNSTILFGVSSATSVVPSGSVSLACNTPAHAVGAVTVTVTNPTSGLFGTYSSYTYNAPGIDPATDWGANLTYYLSSAGITAANSGGRVTQLTDSSSNVFSFGSDATTRGVYSATGLGGQPCVVMSATNSSIGGRSYYSDNGAPSPPTLNQLISSGTDFTIILAVQVDAVSLNDLSNPSAGNGIFGDFSGYFGINAHSRSSGIVNAFIYHSGYHTTPDIAITVGSPMIIAVRHTGGTLYCSVNGGTEQSVSALNPDSTTAKMWFNYGWAGTHQAATHQGIAIVSKSNNTTTLASEIATLKTIYGIA